MRERERERERETARAKPRRAAGLPSSRAAEDHLGVQDLEFRVSGAGSRVQGLGLRV